MKIADFTFQNPSFFWLFVPIVVWVLYYFLFSKKHKPGIQISGGLLHKSTKTWRFYIAKLPFLLRLLALSLIVIALARPISSKVNSEILDGEGIDIVIALDVSSSMLALDFKPNRLEAAKSVAADFISGRNGDRFGLVIYSGESYTQCPITSDKGMIANLLAKVKNGRLADGTAIGLGLGTAVNRLRDSKAKSKVVILLTDGVNNQGEIDPRNAADAALLYDVKVYTIGVGTTGMAKVPAQDFFGNMVFVDAPVEIDETLLKEIADKTGGKYFRATDNKKLKEVYAEIDQLERTKVEEIHFYNFTDLFRNPLKFVFLLLILEVLIKISVLKSVVE